MTLQDRFAEGLDTLGDNFGQVNWSSMMFTASSSYTIRHVRLKMYKAAATGTVTVSIRATSGGLPTGADLCSATFNGDKLTTDSANGSLVWFDFGSGTPLTSGVQYAIVWRATGASSTTAAFTRVLGSGGTFTGANYAGSSNSGGSWSTVSGRFATFYTSDSNTAIEPIDVVSWWRMVNGATDYHSTNDATPAGTTVPALSRAQIPPIGIAAYFFDGSTSYLNLSNPITLRPSFTTVSVWAYRTSAATYSEIYGHGVGGAQGIQLGVDADGTIEAQVWTTIGSVFRNSATSAGVIALNTWYHIACTWDGTDVAVYVNGVLQSVSTSGSGTGAIAYNTSNFNAGSRNGTQYFWAGYLGQLIVSNNVWTSSQVSTLYNSGVGKEYTDYFPLSDRLRSYYSLEGNFTDELATYSGTNVGSTFGNAYIGQGTVQTGTTYWTSPSGLYTGLRGLSVSLWVKADTGASQWNVFGNSDGSGFGLRAQFGFGPPPTGVGFSISNEGNVFTGSGILTVTNWNHLVFTWDGQTKKIYVNGVLQATGSYGGTIGGAGGTLFWGHNGLNNTEGLLGNLDEVAFWGREISAREASRLYNQQAARKYTEIDNPHPLVEGLWAVWQFNGDILNARKTTFADVDNGTTDSASGKLGHARSFNGTSAYIEHGTPTWPLTTSTGTWLAWVKPNLTTPNVFFTKSNTSSDQQNAHIGINDSGANPNFFYYIKRNGTDRAFYAAGVTIVPATWYHLAVSGDNVVNVKMHINGSLQTNTAYTVESADYFNFGSEFRTGTFFRSSTPTGTEFYDGLIDEMGLWNRALTTVEVAASYAGGAGLAYPYFTPPTPPSSTAQRSFTGVVF